MQVLPRYDAFHRQTVTVRPLALAGAGPRHLVVDGLRGAGWSESRNRDATVTYVSPCGRARLLHTPATAPGNTGWKLETQPRPGDDHGWSAWFTAHTPGEIVAAAAGRALAGFATTPTFGDIREPGTGLSILWKRERTNEGDVLAFRYRAIIGEAAFTYLAGDTVAEDVTSLLRGGLSLPEGERPLWRAEFTDNTPHEVINAALRVLDAAGVRTRAQIPRPVLDHPLTASRLRLSPCRTPRVAEAITTSGPPSRRTR
ncbi:DUF317 domain-containing protein [Streptomyces sp. NPDC050085]|uniref:DUF317 domain-containing protein n=1 Tax=Streptomyces sp. NPDC050085 TaxID=3365600 RepID=UPI0037A56C26